VLFLLLSTLSVEILGSCLSTDVKFSEWMNAIESHWPRVVVDKNEFGNDYNKKTIENITVQSIEVTCVFDYNYLVMLLAEVDCKLDILRRKMEVTRSPLHKSFYTLFDETDLEEKSSYCPINRSHALTEFHHVLVYHGLDVFM
jgi:hypothetical protein